ncbi:glycosyltransferase [Pontibacter sp. H249]|uniref:glycosyltransferase n=1 Tax=Pontibacter sp. H249 TaxID=3133420 RepID=UPI0030C029FC
MQYWLLTTEYPPFYGGGISTYCFNTARMLAERGYYVTIFLNDEVVDDYIVEEQDKIRIIRFNASTGETNQFLGYAANLSYRFLEIVKTFIKSEGAPDIIESQEYLGIAYYLLQHKFIRYEWYKNTKFIITLHSPAFLYLEYNQVPLFQYPNYWIGEMERFCIISADICISPSSYLIEEIEKRMYIDRNKIHHVPNPYFADSNEVKKAKAEDIVFFGKLSPQKGTFKLVDYFVELWEEGFNEKLFLIGGQEIVYHPEGKNMGDVVRQKYAKFISNKLLIIEDKLPPGKIKERLESAKVVIIPSIVDNLPYVVMEMMNIGLVVLVSKQGGQSEIVEDGISGFVFDHTDNSSFFNKLKRALSLTSIERSHISLNAVERIKSEYNYNLTFARKSKVIEFLNKESTPFEYPFVHVHSQEFIIGDISGVESKLSVIVPYFNMGTYIEETVNSILLSDYTDIEIIIVNDGSNDIDSIHKLNTLKGDTRIRIIDQKNEGLASARNRGAKEAKGVFIAFLDSDDKVDPRYFTKAINVLKLYSNVHFVGCWTQYFEGSKKVWPTFNPEPPLILYHNLVNSSALVYKKKSFLKAGLNDIHMPFQGLEDYESVISMVTSGYCGIVLPEVLFYYRVRKKSMIRNITKVKKQILIEYITQKHRKAYSNYGIEIYNLSSENGPGIFLDNPTLDYDVINRLPFGQKINQRIVSTLKRNKKAKQFAYRIYKLLK